MMLIHQWKCPKNHTTFNYSKLCL